MERYYINLMKRLIFIFFNLFVIHTGWTQGQIVYESTDPLCLEESNASIMISGLECTSTSTSCYDLTTLNIPYTCSDSYDVSYTSGSNFFVDNGQYVKISEGVNGNVTIQDGSVVICGNVNLNDISLNGSNSRLIILGSLTISGRINTNNTAAEIYNYNTLQLAQQNINCDLYNYGSLFSAQDFIINSQGALYNYNTVQFNSGFTNNAEFINNGVATVSGGAIINSSLATENHCTLNFNQGLIIDNNSGFLNAGDCNIANNNGDATVLMNSINILLTENSYLNANQLNINNSVVKNLGTNCSKMDVGVIINQNSSTIDGNISLCIGDGNSRGLIFSNSANSDCNCILTEEANNTSPDGTFTVDWLNINLPDQPELSGVSAGEYAVTVSNQTCSASETIVISDPQKITAVINTVKSSADEDNGKVVFDISGGVEPYTSITIDGGLAEELVYNEGISIGMHTLKVIDNNGCTESFDFKIEEVQSADESATALKTLKHVTCAGESDGSITIDELKCGMNNYGGNCYSGSKLSDSYDCYSSYDRSLSSGGDHFIKTGETVVIKGNYNGPIEFKGGTLVICGNAELSYVSLNNPSKLVVLGSLKIPGINFNDITVQVLNYGFIEVSSNFSTQGIVENFGEISVANGFNLNTNAQVFNKGKLFITGDLNVGNYSKFQNEGLLSNTGNIQISSEAEFINYCSIMGVNELHVNGSYFENSGSIEIKSKLILRSEKIYLSPSSYMEGDIMTFSDALIKNSGLGCASIVINNSIENFSNVTFDGSISLCYQNGQFPQGYNINYNNGASVNCNCTASPLISGVSLTEQTESEFEVIWDNPIFGTDNPLTGLPAGIYTGVVSNDVCSVNIEYEITEDEPITVDLNLPVYTSCIGAADATVLVQPEGGTGNYSIYLDDKEYPGGTVEGLSAGNHDLKVIDGNDCVFEQNFEILPGQGFEIHINVEDIECPEANPEAIVSVTVEGITQEDLNKQWTVNEDPCFNPDNIIPQYSCASCNEIVSQGYFEIGEGNSACLRNDQSGYINIAGGTLLICGDIYKDQLVLEESTDKVVILGKLTTKGIFFNNVDAELLVYGELIHNGNLIVDGEVNNYGKITINGNVYSNQPQAALNNYNELIINGVTNSNAPVNNYHLFTATDVVVKASSDMQNYCTMEVTNTLTLEAQGHLYNRGVVFGPKQVILRQNAILSVLPYSSFTGDKLISDGGAQIEYIGEEGCSRFTISEDNSINNQLSFTGNINICAPNGLGDNVSLNNGATYSCEACVSSGMYIDGVLSWSNGAIGNNISITEEGTYTVTLNYNGCIETKEFTVDFPDFPDFEITVNDISCSNKTKDGSIVLSSSDPLFSEKYNINWKGKDLNFASTDFELEELRQGTYEYVLTNVADFCEIAGEKYVGKIDEPCIDNTVCESLQEIDFSVSDQSCSEKKDGEIIAILSEDLITDYYWLFQDGQSIKSANIKGLTAGLYDFVYTVETEEYICEDTLSVAVGIKDELTLAQTGDIEPGCVGGNGAEAQIIVGGGTAPYTYYWSAYKYDVPVISGLIPGTHSVEVIDGNQCQNLVTINVPEEEGDCNCNNYNFNLDPEHVTCNGDNSGGFSIVVPDNIKSKVSRIICKKNETSVFNNGDIIYEFFNLSNGTYQVEIFFLDENGNECSIPSKKSVTIWEPEPIAYDKVFKNPTYKNSTDGKLEIYPKGGTKDYTIQWVDAQDGYTEIFKRPSVGEGVYEFTIQDKRGCVATFSEKLEGINEECDPEENPECDECAFKGYEILHLNDDGCSEPNTGEIELGIIGTYENYTIQWDNGYNALNISSLKADDYAFDMEITEGDLTCLFNDVLLIDEKPSIHVAHTASIPVCKSDKINADLDVINGTPPYTYSWKDETNARSENIRTELEQGTLYEVEVKDVNGCLTPFSFRTLTNNNDCEGKECEQSNVVLKNKSITCFKGSDGELTAKITSELQLKSIKWYKNNKEITAFEGYRVIKELGEADYSVDVILEDEDGNICEKTDKKQVVAPVDIVINDETFPTCQNKSTGRIELNPKGGNGNYSYDWYSMEGEYEGKHKGRILRGLSVGKIVAEVTDKKGCTKRSEPIEINSSGEECNQCNEISYNYIPHHPNCTSLNSGEIIFTDLINIGPIDIMITNKEGYQSRGAIHTGLSSGEYYLSIETILSGQECSLKDTILLYPDEFKEIDIDDDALASCNNDDVEDALVSIINPKNYIYEWHYLNKIKTSHEAYLPAGNHELIVKEKNYECSFSVPVSIGYKSDECDDPCRAFEVDLDPVEDINCYGENTAVLEFTTSHENANIVWYKGDVLGIEMEDFSGEKVLSDLSAGTYTVKASIELTTEDVCEKKISHSFFNPDYYKYKIQTKDATCEDGLDGEVWVSTKDPRALELEWFKNDIPLTGNNNKKFLTNLSPGDYTVIITDKVGCELIPEGEKLEQEDGKCICEALQYTLKPDNFDCFDSQYASVSFELQTSMDDITNTPVYTWVLPDNTSRSGASIEMLEVEGKYTFSTSLEYFGVECYVNESVTLIKPDEFKMESTGANPPSCATAEDGAVFTRRSGGLGSITYQYSDGSSLPDLTSVKSGTHVIYATDKNNCKARFNAEVPSNEAPCDCAYDYQIKFTEDSKFNYSSLPVSGDHLEAYLHHVDDETVTFVPNWYLYTDNPSPSDVLIQYDGYKYKLIENSSEIQVLDDYIGSRLLVRFEISSECVLSKVVPITYSNGPDLPDGIDSYPTSCLGGLDGKIEVDLTVADLNEELKTKLRNFGYTENPVFHVKLELNETIFYNDFDATGVYELTALQAGVYKLTVENNFGYHYSGNVEVISSSQAVCPCSGLTIETSSATELDRPWGDQNDFPVQGKEDFLTYHESEGQTANITLLYPGQDFPQQKVIGENYIKINDVTSGSGNYNFSLQNLDNGNKVIFTNGQQNKWTGLLGGSYKFTVTQNDGQECSVFKEIEIRNPLENIDVPKTEEEGCGGDYTVMDFFTMLDDLGGSDEKILDFEWGGISNPIIPGEEDSKGISIEDVANYTEGGESDVNNGENQALQDYVFGAFFTGRVIPGGVSSNGVEYPLGYEYINDLNPSKIENWPYGEYEVYFAIVIKTPSSQYNANDPSANFNNYYVSPLVKTTIYIGTEMVDGKLKPKYLSLEDFDDDPDVLNFETCENDYTLLSYYPEGVYHIKDQDGNAVNFDFANPILPSGEYELFYRVKDFMTEQEITTYGNDAILTSEANVLANNTPCVNHKKINIIHKEINTVTDYSHTICEGEDHTIDFSNLLTGDASSFDEEYIRERYVVRWTPSPKDVILLQNSDLDSEEYDALFEELEQFKVNDIAFPAAALNQNTRFTVGVYDKTLPRSCAKEFSYEVKVEPTPQISVQDEVTICYGSGFNLLIPDEYSYSWSPSSGITELPQVGNDRIYEINPVNTTTYTLNASNPYCSSSEEFQVNVTPEFNPYVEVLTGEEHCLEDHNLVKVRVDKGSSFKWRPLDQIENNENQEVIVNASILNSVSVEVTDEYGCVKNPTLDIESATGIGVASNYKEVCFGGSATLEAIGAEAYQWEPLYGITDESEATTASVNTSVTSNTIYRVSTTNNYGCNVSATVEVEVDVTCNCADTDSETAEFYWVGKVSSDWNVAENWSTKDSEYIVPSRVPSYVSDNVIMLPDDVLNDRGDLIIENDLDVPKNLTINNICILNENYDLNIADYELSVTGHATFHNSTTNFNQSGKLDIKGEYKPSPNVAIFYKATLNVPVTGTELTEVYHHETTFGENVHLQMNGSKDVISNGLNIFEKDAVFINSGDATWTFSGHPQAGKDIYKGSTTFGGKGQMMLSDLYIDDYYGDIFVNNPNAVFGNNGGVVRLTGIKPQVVGSDNIIPVTIPMNKLQLDKSLQEGEGTPSQTTDAKVTLYTDVEILNKETNYLKLVNGIIETSDKALLSINIEPRIIDVDDKKIDKYYNGKAFISGPLHRIIGSGEFIYPVGKNGRYMPVIVYSEGNGFPVGYLAEFIESAFDSFTRDENDETFRYVNECEYWRFEGPQDNFKLEISWDEYTCDKPVTLKDYLVTAYHTADQATDSKWISLGHERYTGSSIFGFVENKDPFVYDYEALALGSTSDPGDGEPNGLSFNNYGATVSISEGHQLAVFGNILNEKTDTEDPELKNPGEFSNQGVVYLSKDWTNNVPNNAFKVDVDGELQLIGGDVKLIGEDQRLRGEEMTQFLNLYALGSGVKTMRVNVNVAQKLNLYTNEVATQEYTLYVNTDEPMAITQEPGGLGYVSSKDGGFLKRDVIANQESLHEYLYPVAARRRPKWYRPLVITPELENPNFIRSYTVTSDDYTNSENAYEVRLVKSDPTADGYNRKTRSPYVERINESFYHIIQRDLGDEDDSQDGGEDYTKAVNLKVFYNENENFKYQTLAQWDKDIGKLTQWGTTVYPYVEGVLAESLNEVSEGYWQHLPYMLKKPENSVPYVTHYVEVFNHNDFDLTPFSLARKGLRIQTQTFGDALGTGIDATYHFEGEGFVDGSRTYSSGINDGWTTDSYNGTATVGPELFGGSEPGEEITHQMVVNSDIFNVSGTLEFKTDWTGNIVEGSLIYIDAENMPHTLDESLFTVLEDGQTIVLNSEPAEESGCTSSVEYIIGDNSDFILGNTPGEPYTIIIDFKETTVQAVKVYNNNDLEISQSNISTTGNKVTVSLDQTTSESGVYTIEIGTGINKIQGQFIVK